MVWKWTFDRRFLFLFLFSLLSRLKVTEKRESVWRSGDDRKASVCRQRGLSGWDDAGRGLSGRIKGTKEQAYD